MSEMNIEVGEYVRTKNGIVAKCIKEKQDRYVFNRIVLEQGYYNDYILKDIPERANFIIKHSKNIIDLIEVGDYVNGEKIQFINRGNLITEGGYDLLKKYKEISTIVTKEQFRNIEYKAKK